MSMSSKVALLICGMWVTRLVKVFTKICTRWRGLLHFGGKLLHEDLEVLLELGVLLLELREAAAQIGYHLHDVEAAIEGVV